MPSQGRLGDKSQVPADAHGCPACPHSATGPAIIGSPDVLVNNRPALRLGDMGIHAACCGPNTWVAVQGSATVLINGKPAHRLGDMDVHCGGPGNLIEGSADVFVGDETAVATALSVAAVALGDSGSEAVSATAVAAAAREEEQAAAAESAGPQEHHRFEFRIVDEDCRVIRLRRPTPYRVCDRAGAVIQQGTLSGEAVVVVEGDPGRRYGLWLDGEFVTFHDERGG